MPLTLDRRSFTIIEIIIVVIIIGILAALALPGFGVTKERTLDKEAKASLMLIQAAEEIYKMENKFYFPYPGGSVNQISGEGGINDKLKVGLPPNQANWTYIIDTSVVSNEKATATRVGAGGRVWTILFPPGSSDIPACTGATGCP
ncbi:MAG: prepilin-type N-terminal cleavage/methylation domain-containing protein [Candidatus Omnitrophica bacterium]|nr:prepilin-type N-terminal cleavage/methylation domain-containing protein [Candidatus Omnitrophota bacterium]